MEKSAGQRQSSKAKTAPFSPIPLMLLILCLPHIKTSNPNPYTPYQLTWEVMNWETHEVYNSTSQEAPLNTWFPDLYFNLDKVADIERMEGGNWRKVQRRVSVSRNGFYACPGFRKGSERLQCGGVESLYCAQWSCVTTNDGEWKWRVTPQLITLSFIRPCTRTWYNYNCNLIRLQFTEKGKRDKRWLSGLTWGLYLYQRPSFGTVIQIKLKAEPIVKAAIGPNKVLTEESPKEPKIIAPPPSTGTPRPGLVNTDTPPHPKNEGPL